MKGIILAGGTGSRLYPVTYATNKHLVPIYDKPLIYYPLCTLMLAGVREIMVISDEKSLPVFRHLFGNGEKFGLEICYAVQNEPRGIAEAFVIAESFIGDDAASLALGDNIVFGQGLTGSLQAAACAVSTAPGCNIFGYHVEDPERYGIIELDKSGTQVLSLEEKPTQPKSNWAAIGLYFYDNTVVERAKSLTPSARGELEITDLNKSYLADGVLNCTRLGRGYYWMDAGTPESLMDASQFVHNIQHRVGYLVSSPEEVAHFMHYIDTDQLSELIKPLQSTRYGRQLAEIVKANA